MVKVQRGERFRHASGLIKVEAVWAAGLYGAESAGACAGVAQDHHGRGPLLPALANVWAARLFTDGIQRLRAHERLQFAIARAAWCFRTNPLGVL